MYESSIELATTNYLCGHARLQLSQLCLSAKLELAFCSRVRYWSSGAHLFSNSSSSKWICEGDRLTYYCTTASPPLPYSQFLNVSSRLLQAPEHAYEIFISGQSMNLHPVNVLTTYSIPMDFFQSRGANSPNLALFPFQLWRVANAPFVQEICQCRWVSTYQKSDINSHIFDCCSSVFKITVS